MYRLKITERKGRLRVEHNPLFKAGFLAAFAVLAACVFVFGAAPGSGESVRLKHAIGYYLMLPVGLVSLVMAVVTALQPRDWLEADPDEGTLVVSTRGAERKVELEPGSEFGVVADRKFAALSNVCLFVPRRRKNGTQATPRVKPVLPGWSAKPENALRLVRRLNAFCWARTPDPEPRKRARKPKRRRKADPSGRQPVQR